MTWADAWSDAVRHPDAMANLEYHCLREHVVDMVYECHLPSDRPMVLLLHDERPTDRAILLQRIDQAAIRIQAQRVGQRRFTKILKKH